MTYEYWKSWNDVVIFRVQNVREHGISLQDFKIKLLKARAIPLI